MWRPSGCNEPGHHACKYGKSTYVLFSTYVDLQCSYMDNQISWIKVMRARKPPLERALFPLEFCPCIVVSAHHDALPSL